MRPALGIHLGFSRTLPVPERLRLIRDAGFDTTSLWWPAVDGEMRRLRDAVPGMCRELGLGIDHLHLPYRGCDALWSQDNALRDECVHRHLVGVDECAAHGVPRMVMHVTLKTRVERDEQAGIKSLTRIVERAAKCGVEVAIENTRDAECVAVLLDAIDTLGLCYDNAHDELHSTVPRALLERYPHRLATTHLSDSDGKRDRHWPPGDGVLAFDDVLDAVAGGERETGCIVEAVMGKSEADAAGFLERVRVQTERLLAAVVPS